MEALAGISCVQVAAGAIHSAALSEFGKIYVWGFGEYLFGKSKRASNFAFTPRVIELKERVLQIAAGQSHMLCLTESHDVLAWGANDFGQLGTGDFGNTRTPRLCLLGKDILQIAAGRYHSSALSSNGALYSWGNGESGQLGHNNDDHAPFPQVVGRLMANVVGQVACGEHHTVALCSARYTGKAADDVSEWCVFSEWELLFEFVCALLWALARALEIIATTTF